MGALIETRERVPDIQRLQIEVPLSTEAWNEQVIRQGFRREHGRNPTEEEILQTAQTYKTGSQYELNIDLARGLWHRIINGDAQAWSRYVTTARTTSKTTGCHGTEGPVEYEFARLMQRRLQRFIEHEQSITRGMHSAIRNVPDLEHRIKVFIIRKNKPLRGHFPELSDEEITGSPHRLAREIIRDSRILYNDNIPKGNEDTSYCIWKVLLYGLAGGFLGGLAGFGVDALVDKKLGRKIL